MHKDYAEKLKNLRNMDKKSINSFIKSLDNGVFDEIRNSKGDAECRRCLREHLNRELGQKTPHWKQLFNAESDGAYWEIWHNTTQKTVKLHYVPEEDYSDGDVQIEMPYEQFEDLVKFIIMLV